MTDEIEVDVVVEDESVQIEWPDGWPIPRVGDDVDTGNYWLTVSGVVWKLYGEDRHVQIVLSRAERVAEMRIK